METYSWWENVILGGIVLLAVMWMQNGAKAAFQRSKAVSSDWMSVLVPLGFVVLFVIFLIMMV